MDLKTAVQLTKQLPNLKAFASYMSSTGTILTFIRYFSMFVFSAVSGTASITKWAISIASVPLRILFYTMVIGLTVATGQTIYAHRNDFENKKELWDTISNAPLDQIKLYTSEIFNRIYIMLTTGIEWLKNQPVTEKVKIIMKKLMRMVKQKSSGIHLSHLVNPPVPSVLIEKRAESVQPAQPAQPVEKVSLLKTQYKPFY